MDLLTEYNNLKRDYKTLKEKKDYLEQLFYDLIERYETLYKQVYGDIPPRKEYAAARKLKDEDMKILGGKHE